MSDVRVTQVSDRFIDEFVYEGVESDLMGVSDARRMLHIFNSQGGRGLFWWTVNRWRLWAYSR